jgi:iron complex outermembrane receptor protein
MKKFYNLLLIFVCLISVQAFSQTINGRILDESNIGLPGASVKIANTTNGTAADINGKFSLKVPAGDVVLEYSYTGYDKIIRTYKVGDGQTINISVNLKPKSNDIGEVVVVGYGTTEKKDLTGSVASINSKDFQKGTVATPEQLILGKVAGVQITPNGGNPGSGSTIRIRGGSSLNASNDPLIVIDGVPVDNGGIGGSANPLSLINPNDIENMTILKDASATAIYGSRASNGVIIITTKKGSKSGKLIVDVNTVHSISQVTRLTEVLSADEFRRIVTEKGTPQKIALLGNANTDWQKEIYRLAYSTDNNISFTGGVKKLPYRLSVGMFSQNGVLITDQMNRANVGLNLSPTFFKEHLKVEFNHKTSYSAHNFANTGAIGSAVGFDPTKPVTIDSDRFGGYYEWLNGNVPNALAARNPVGLINQRSDKSNVYRHLGNVQVDYKFHKFPALRANVNVGYDFQNSNGEVIETDSSASSYRTNSKGLFSQYEQRKENKVFDFYLNYKKDYTKYKSVVDVTAGYSYQDWYFESPNIRTLQGNKIDTIPGDLPPRFPFNKAQNTLISFYGRLNYSFNQKYLLTATVRSDGSSRFAKEERWGIFPSAAFAWRMGEEKFFKKFKKLSDLKLRVGYGITGQQDIGANFNYLPIYVQGENTAAYQFGNNYLFTFRPSRYDPNFRWESTATTNAGIDFGFYDGRISGAIDVYYRKTTDLIAEIGVPAGTNFSNTILTNVGSIENKGIEFIINTVPIAKKNLEWNVGFNFTLNRNKVLSLNRFDSDTSLGNLVGGIAGGVGNTIQINTVGQPINTFYVYEQLYNAEGKPIEAGTAKPDGSGNYTLLDAYKDQNGDGVINSRDLYRYKGNPQPQFSIGFNTSLNYKKWSFGFQLRGSFGNYVYNNVHSNNGILNAILPATPTLSNGSVNYLETNFRTPQYFSDYYIQKAWFIRFDNINVGYNIGNIYKDKVRMRVFASVQNALVITPYTGVDPEIFNGIDNTIYPRPRIYNLGLNFNF